MTIIQSRVFNAYNDNYSVILTPNLPEYVMSVDDVAALDAHDALVTAIYALYNIENVVNNDEYQPLMDTLTMWRRQLTKRCRSIIEDVVTTANIPIGS